MKLFLKWLGRGLAVLVILAGIGVLLGYAALNASLPDANGAASLPGLDAKAQILRDENGVPHIEASSHVDAVRALGFAHAQDRLWQMHVLRMVAQGRLSEMFGTATVNADIFLQTLGMAEAARRSFDVLSDEAKAFLSAYADGVNAWRTRDVGFLGVGMPPEFVILGVDAEAWEPWHSIAIIKVMALTLDSNIDEEIRRLALARRGFNSREIDDLIPYGPRDNPPPLPDLRKLYDYGEGAALSPSSGGWDLPWEIGISASNNWVVSGERTESGKPLLANDPHLNLQTPTVFYLAHMAFRHEGEERHIVGGSLPGTPFVLAGRNDRMAWGLTTTNLDAQDIFVERLKPDDDNQYLTPGGWQPFEEQVRTILVKDAPERSFTLRRTRHGPVLPMGYRNLEQILPAGHVAALRWVSAADDDTTVQGVMHLNRSRNAAEFMQSTREMVAPMQSVVFADQEGDIGVIAPARVPLRDKDNLVAGRAPVPGWIERYDWKGWLAHDKLPQLSNPPEGAIATANANWLPSGYSDHITYDWDEHFRQARVEEQILAAQTPHSPKSMEQTLGDDYSPALVAFRDIAMDRLEIGAGQDSAILAEVRAWDGRMQAESPLPLIMTAWWRHAGRLLFEDDLVSDYSRFGKGYLSPVINALTQAGARDWCDNRKTDRRENCGITLAQAMAAALDELRATYGQNWRDWRWGEAHRSLGEHRPFSSVGVLARFFAVTPRSGGGSYTLLRGRTDFTGDEPYRNVHASAYRAWYDLADLDSSRYVISTGQSGHFLSEHYDDLADDWSELRYVTIPTQRDAYIDEIKGVWTLNP